MGRLFQSGQLGPFSPFHQTGHLATIPQATNMIQGPLIPDAFQCAICPSAFSKAHPPLRDPLWNHRLESLLSPFFCEPGGKGCRIIDWACIHFGVRLLRWFGVIDMSHSWEVFCFAVYVWWHWCILGRSCTLSWIVGGICRGMEPPRHLEGAMSAWDGYPLSQNPPLFLAWGGQGLSKVGTHQNFCARPWGAKPTWRQHIWYSRGWSMEPALPF